MPGHHPYTLKIWIYIYRESVYVCVTKIILFFTEGGITELLQSRDSEREWRVNNSRVWVMTQCKSFYIFWKSTNNTNTPEPHHNIPRNIQKIVPNKWFLIVIISCSKPLIVFCETSFFFNLSHDWIRSPSNIIGKLYYLNQINVYHLFFTLKNRINFLLELLSLP